MRKDLYDVFLEAGVEISNHYSDMYVPVNEFTTKTLIEYSDIHTYSQFTNQLNGERYYDIPFAFSPYWYERANRANLDGEANE